MSKKRQQTISERIIQLEQDRNQEGLNKLAFAGLVVSICLCGRDLSTP